MARLDRTTLDEIINVLEPELRDEASRRAYFDLVFAGMSRRPDLDLSGAAHQATLRMVMTLHQFGTLDSTTPALWALCEVIMPTIGADRQARLEAMREVIFAGADSPPSPVVVQPSEPPARAHVFVSYSRQNRAFVEQLTADLQAAGIDVWIDRSGLKPGTRNWENALRAAIRDAFAVVLVASPPSRQSNFVQAELDIATMYGLPLLPVWVEGEHWIESAPMALSRVQYIDMRASSYTTSLPAIIEQLRALGVSSVESPSEDAPLPLRNPYKGLRAFEEADTDFFFGRETLVETLLPLLDSERFLALVGGSGSGKSSVIMAGVLPRLRERQQWRILPVIVPGIHPLDTLALLFADAFNMAISDVRKDLDTFDGRGLHLLADRLARREQTERLVLYIDQFEETFTLTTSEDERRQFIDLLVKAINEPRGTLTVILTLRADFYDRPLNYPELGKLVDTHSKSILQMTVDDLRSAIEQPAARVGLGFEDGLVGDLLFEVRDQAGALPLLQFTLDLLYRQCVERDGERQLTRAAYRALGGVRGALAQHAEATYAALASDDHRRMARALFLRLIEPGTSEQDTTRRRAQQVDLTLPDPAQTATLTETAADFINARLVVTDGGAEPTIEVSHEALIREWERLRTWLSEGREDVRLQNAISQDAADWRRNGQRADDLYRGARLIDAQAWAKRNTPSADEQVFIDAGTTEEIRRIAEEERRIQELNEATQQAGQAKQEADRAARRARMSRNQVIAAIIAAIVISLVAITLTLSSARQAQQLSDNAAATAQAAVATAQDAQQAAATQEAAAGTRVAQVGETLTPAREMLDDVSTQAADTQSELVNSQARIAANFSRLAFDQNKPQNALVLAVEAMRNYPTIAPLEAQNALINALNAPIRQVSRFYQPAASSGGMRLNADGSRLLSWGPNGTATVWDLRTNEALFSLFLPDRLILAEWSQDESRIITFDGYRVGVWDAETGELRFTNSEGLSGFGTGTLFWNASVTMFFTKLDSPTLIDVTSNESTVVDYDVAESGTDAAAWNADNSLLFIWQSTNLTAYDIAKHAVRYVIPYQNGGTGALSHDGKRLLSYESMSQTVDVYDADTGKKLLTLNHGSPMILGSYLGGSGVQWSKDDSRILIWSSDGAVSLWDAGSGEYIYSLEQTDTIRRAYWNDDESLIITQSDGIVRVWDATDSSLVSQNVIGDEILIHWNADDTFITFDSQSADTKLRTRDGIILYTVNSGSRLPSVLWDAQNQHLIVASDDTIEVWQPEQLVVSEECPVLRTALSPDGAKILTLIGHTPADYQLRLWDVNSATLLKTKPFVDQTPLFSWSPNGQYILMVSPDGDAQGFQVWNSTLSRQLYANSDNPGDAHWSDDGRYIVASSTEGENPVLRLYDPVSGEVIQEYAADANRIAFSPDGKRALLWNGNANFEFKSTIYLFDTETGELIRSFAADADSLGGGGGSGGGGGGGNPDCIGAVQDPPQDRLIVMWRGDGQQILTSYAFDGTLRVWDINGEGYRMVDAGNGGGFWQASYSPDSRSIIAGDSQILKAWDVESLEPHILQTFPSAITDLLWSSQNRLLLTFNYPGTPAVLPDLNHPELVLNLPIAGYVAGMSWHPDGDHVVEWGENDSSGDGYVRFVDTNIERSLELARQQAQMSPLSPAERESYLLPTLTPLPSPTPFISTLVSRDAQVGSQRGEIAEPYARDEWRYRGRAGEVLTITVLADHPGSGTDPFTWVTEGKFDSYLEIYSSDDPANIHHANDDRDPTPVTNPDGSTIVSSVTDSDSQIDSLTLPEDGEYVIAVSSAFGGVTVGAYTLVIESQVRVPTPTLMTPTPSPTATPG